MRSDTVFSTSRQLLTFAFPSWISFNVQIYKAGKGCGWLESRTAVITEKNEEEVEEGESSPPTHHTGGVIGTEGPCVTSVCFTQWKKLWLTIGLRV